MLKVLDRLFVWSAWCSFLLLIFFDVIFQTAGHRPAEEMSSIEAIITTAKLEDWQRACLYVSAVILPVSLLGLWVTGLILWYRSRSQN